MEKITSPVNKRVIARHFSRHAAVYDRYADIQRKVAEELAAGIARDGFKEILEIGCGTGNLTRLLVENHRRASLLAVDISQDMLAVARRKVVDGRVIFAAGDAEAMKWPTTFDCIVSNACFQWFGDIASALAVYHGALSGGGLMAFSTFGPETFCELQTALAAVFPGTSLGARYFPTQEKLRLHLQKHFVDVVVREARYQEDFVCLEDLLKKIKYTGATGQGMGRWLNRSVLVKIEEAYLARFGRVRATYQVFFCFGVKP